MTKAEFVERGMLDLMGSVFEQLLIRSTEVKAEDQEKLKEKMSILAEEFYHYMRRLASKMEDQGHGFRKGKER